MNEKYLRGYFETYVQPSRKDATYEGWVSKIKDNDEYKRGMFETNVLPSKADATYDDWNAKVFGGASVKKKEPSAPAVAGGAGASQNVPTQQPAPATGGPAVVGQNARQASPSTSKSTSVSGVGDKDQDGFWSFAKILAENKNKEFVQRMFKSELGVKNADGTVSTHKMATANVDGKEIAFPTIINENGKLVDYSKDINKAIDFALKKNEYISFDDPKKAREFAEGAWKKVVEEVRKPRPDATAETSDYEMGAYMEPEGLEALKTKREFTAAQVQARGALYDIQSGKAPTYVKANELDKIVQAGGLELKGFGEYQREVADRNKAIKAEHEKIEQQYLQNGPQKIKEIADSDQEFVNFYSKIQDELTQYAQTGPTQQDFDAFVDQKNIELNNAYDLAKDRAVKKLDAEIQTKFEDVYKKLTPGTDLIEKSGLKDKLDQIVNDPNFDSFSFDKKMDVLRSMYVTMGNSLAKKGVSDATSLLKLREQLDANYLSKFYISKKGQVSPFGLKQYAEEELPELRKKLKELESRRKEEVAMGDMTGGVYTEYDETGARQISVNDAMTKTKQAINNLEKIIELPDEINSNEWQSFLQGFSSVSLGEKLPFLGSVIGAGRTLNLLDAATKDQQTEFDKSLLKTEAMFQSYYGQTQNQRDAFFDAGMSTAYSLPFMGESIATLGVGRTAVKGAETLAEKWIKDYATSRVRRYALKPLFETIGTIAQTAANPQQVFKNTFERMTPEMQLILGPDGDGLVAFVDKNTGESFEEAFLKGFGVSWAQFFTERAGSALPFYTKGASGQLISKSPDWAKRVFISLYMRKTGSTIGQVYSRLKNVGWNGILAEMGEEIAVMPLENIITGDYKDPRLGPYSSVLNGIVDPKTGEIDEENLKTIAISTAAMTLPMVGAGMVVSALPKNKTSINLVDINGNAHKAELRNSILAQIIEASKKGGVSLSEWRNTKLGELGLSMDETYVANRVIDALENKNAQTRLGSGALSEADAKLIDELDKLDLEAAAETAPEGVTPTEVAPTEVTPEAVAPAEAAPAVVTEGAAPSVPSPEADIKAKKADIERKRQKELDGQYGAGFRLEKRTETTNEQLTDRNVGSIEKAIQQGIQQGKSASEILGILNALGFIPANIGNGTEALRNYLQSRIDGSNITYQQVHANGILTEINAKYDAELAALETAPQAAPATEVTLETTPSVPSPEAPKVEVKPIINEQAVVANTTKEGLITTENTIGDDVSQLDADPRNSEEFTYIDLKGEKRTDRGHGLAQNAKYRVFKGKSGKKYVQVGMTALDAGGRDGGASVIFEATGDVTPQMEQAIFDLKAENYKDGNVINEKGLNKFKADVTAILKGEAMQAAPAIEATTAPAAETAPSLPSPEATQTAEVNRQAVRVFEEISPLLDARKGADVKNKRDINKAISEKIKSNPKADFIYTNWNKLKKQLKFEHEGNCP